MPSPAPPRYCGRFAPSPTGPLHLGSLIAALASFLDARHHHGRWLVRMDDLDPPREEVGAASRILSTLQRHQLIWDNDILWQSRRSSAYDHAVDRLAAQGSLFYCQCSRNQLAPGGACRKSCRDRQADMTAPCARRVTVPSDCIVRFCDAIQGEQLYQLGHEQDNFAVRRKDGLYAYQLAVTVDDAEQGITHVVRGSDLLTSTPRQIFLQHLLGYQQPVYCHVPVITNREGVKYSKQNHAPPLDDERAPENLRRALCILGQVAVPEEATDCARILDFAARHWSLDRIPAVPAVTSAAT